MKKPILLLAAIVVFEACQQATNEQGAEASTAQETTVQAVPTPALAYFGTKITEEGAINTDGLMAALGEADSVDLKVVGKVDKVCQAKGCWMTIAYGEGESMRVSFRDYGFFVPKDIDGKEAVIEGTLYMETTSVEDLRHYAEDEGLSAEEIAAITEDETSLTFVADGVIVKDYVIEAGEGTLSEPADDHDDHSGHDH